MQLTWLDCAHGSRLVVQNAPRAEVLRGLAQAWGFRLDLSQSVPGTVRLDAEGPPDTLLQRVLHPHSFLLLRQPDTRCPGQLAIARVMVIAASGSAAAPPRLPGPPRTSAPALAPHAYTEQADTLTQSYLHSHGALRPGP